MATYYIAPAPTGSDSNAGTQASPWLTLDYAYAHSTTNDTIYFMAGTHNWVDSPTAGYTYRIFQGAGATTILSGGSYTLGASWLLDQVTINDMTFTYNGNTDHGYCGDGMFYGLNSQNLSTITFNRCIFHDLVVGDAGGGDWASGMICSKDRSGSTVDATLNSCLLYDIRRYSGTTWGPIYCSQIVNATPVAFGHFYCYNCTFYLATTPALANLCWISAECVASVNFKNCIVYNGGGGTMNWTGGLWSSINATVNYCDAYLMTGTVIGGVGNITSDPQFINAAGLDFRLKPTSPCVKTGSII